MRAAQLGRILGIVLFAVSAQAGPVSLTAEIGSTLVVPIGDEASAQNAAGYAGSATGPDPQRGEIVYSISGGQLRAPVDLITQATFLAPVSPKSSLFDDPVSARLYRGKVVSLVRVPTNRGLSAGDGYELHARVVRGTSVTPLEYSASLSLSMASPGQRANISAPWDFILSWLPAKASTRSPAGFDLSLSVPRPALQLQWSWSGGPEIRGTPPELDDGANKILGVQLVVHYPRRLIRVARVFPPVGRELAIWSQDDHTGELAIQAVSRDGLSLDHLEVAFDLDGDRPLDPADPIDGIRVEMKRAIDERGYPADRGRTPPWSLTVADVTVR